MAVVTPPTIRALPAAPDPNDRATFNARAYPWAAAQAVLATEVNAVASNVEANANDAAANASIAIDQVDLATTQAVNSATSADAAQTQAEISIAKASEASTSAADAESSRIAASKLNLGNKSTAPTLDDQGGALLAGATYYDTAFSKWRVWSGSAWVEGVSAVAGVSSLNGKTGAVTGIATNASNTYDGAQNFSLDSLASAATTASIWAAAGNQINFTGTATVTTFPDAPQGGAERTLICASSCSFTASANMLIDGVAIGVTVTCAANDQMIVKAVSTTRFKLSRVKYDGTAQVSGGVPFGALIAIVDPTSSNTISNADGSIYLKSGVIDLASTYPDAPAGPYMAQTAENSASRNGDNPAYGTGVWVIPYAGGVTVSADLYTWTDYPLMGVLSTSMCQYLNGRFIVFAGNSVVAYTSTNGTAWSSITMPVALWWADIAGNGTRYVAVGRDTNIYHSTNLTTWTAVAMGYAVSGITYANSLFMAVGTGASGVTGINRSSDGVNWIAASSVTISNTIGYPNFIFVAYTASKWLAITELQYNSDYSVYAARGAYSTDNGVTWSGSAGTLPRSNITNGNCKGLSVVNNNFYLATSQGQSYGTEIFYYGTTSSWTVIGGQYRQYAQVTPTQTSKGKLVTDGGLNWLSGGGVLSVDGGVHWGALDMRNIWSSPAPKEVAYGGGKYIVALSTFNNASYGNNYSLVGVSTNGKDFRTHQIKIDDARAYGVEGVWTGAAYFNGYYILGNQSAIYYSLDTISWSAVSGSPGTTTGVGARLRVAGNKVYALNDSYLYSGDPTSTSTSFAYSMDGVNWLSSSVLSNVRPFCVAYGSDKYMMTQGRGNANSGCWTSDDGINNWTAKGSSLCSDTRDIIFLNNNFFRFNKTGLVQKSSNLGVTWTTVKPIGSAFTDCDWASAEGGTVIAGAFGSLSYLISTDGINFYTRRSAVSPMNYHGGMGNGYAISAQYPSSNYPLKPSVSYVLNDAPQFASETVGTLGAPLYMKVK